jgi:glycerol-3-phosphate acyltransferase PlsY
MDLLIYAVIAAASYLIGSLNGPLLVSRVFLRDDIRRHGSGNAGATNVLRTYGAKWTAGVTVWDLGKGIAAVFLGRGMAPADGTGIAMLTAGMFVIIGHVFPVFFKFKGGKGVMTACAVFFTLDWRVASVAMGLFLLIVILTRYVSLGSIFAVLTLPVMGLLLGRPPVSIGMYAAVALLVVLLHIANIHRLLKGSENKFSLKRSS